MRSISPGRLILRLSIASWLIVCATVGVTRGASTARRDQEEQRVALIDRGSAAARCVHLVWVDEPADVTRPRPSDSYGVVRSEADLPVEDGIAAIPYVIRARRSRTLQFFSQINLFGGGYPILPDSNLVILNGPSGAGRAELDLRRADDIVLTLGPQFSESASCPLRAATRP